nr:hypothetical protein [Oceanococcus sp. HetDA_MAG_MS8]
MRDFLKVAAFGLILGGCSSGEVPPDDSPLVDHFAANTPGDRLPECADSGGSDPIADYQCRWEYRALFLQNKLGLTLPLVASETLATHNSYNSTHYFNSLEGGIAQADPNQQISILDQLRLGARGLEFDVHFNWHIPSLSQQALLCHSVCSGNDRLLRKGLQEIADFFMEPANSREVVLLDIGDGDKGDQAGHLAILDDIEATLGGIIFRPPADGSCHTFPLQLSKQDILEAGKHVLIHGGCGIGESWTATVWANDRKQKANDGFDAFPDCESEFFSAEDYANRYIRLWEDATFIGSFRPLEAIDGGVAAQMQRCGVNMISVDMLQPQDDVLTGVIWSWAAEQPPVHDGQSLCAKHNASGRFEAIDCQTRLPVACTRNDGEYLIARTPVSWDAAAQTCTALSARFAVPRSASRSQQLVQRKTEFGITELWINSSETEDNLWH